MVLHVAALPGNERFLAMETAALVRHPVESDGLVLSGPRFHACLSAAANLWLPALHASPAIEVSHPLQEFCGPRKGRCVWPLPLC